MQKTHVTHEPGASNAPVVSGQARLYALPSAGWRQCGVTLLDQRNEDAIRLPKIDRA